MAVWSLCTHSDGRHFGGPLLGHKTNTLDRMHSHLVYYTFGGEAALFPDFSVFPSVCIHNIDFHVLL